MTARQIAEMACVYVGQLPEESEDLMAMATYWINNVLVEVLPYENAWRAGEGREELEAAPWIESLDEEVPYCDGLTRNAIPYWLACSYLQEDDLDNRAQHYYNRYVQALEELQKHTALKVERVVDVYDGGVHEA